MVFVLFVVLTGSGVIRMEERVMLGQPSVSDGGRAVVVQWDCGERCKCRCGLEGKYDLRVLDSAPAGKVNSD